MVEEDSEKRFHAVMDKLFRAPPKPKSTSTTTTPTSNSNSSREVQLPRGQKRANGSAAFPSLEHKSRGDMVDVLRNSLVSGGSVNTPLCRPWDREDLTRRLATFKSMTWFAKPKVVSAVNCARRGWVNVEMDTIACESCRARLLFSTPSSWPQQQVEKAALVFSLKLDNGHKLHCPWIDNSCDEKLAQFPSMPAVVLVDDYKKRYSALSHLLALPMISSAAIDCMRSHPLEHFLAGSSIVDCGSEPAGTSQTEYLTNVRDEDSAVMYYQAQKLISLCGWEPRLLPYIIDCKNQQDQSSKDVYLLDSSLVVHTERNPSISVYSSSTNQSMVTIDDPMAYGGMLSDPNSVVLDCKLCGSSVGLWAFSTVPRPMELFRLVGFTEVNGENDFSYGGPPLNHDSSNENHVDDREGVMNIDTTGATSSSERPSNLNLTIAGGPTPAKQNFRARISLPVIGSNLRARISSESYFRDPHNDTVSLSVQSFQPGDTGLLQCKGYDGEHGNSTSNDEFPCLKIDNSEQGDMLAEEDSCYMLLEGENIGGQGFPETSTPDFTMQNLLQNTPDFADSSGKDDENAKIDETVSPTVGDRSCSQVEDPSSTTPDVHVIITPSEGNENASSIMVEADNGYLQQNPGIEGQQASGIKSIVQPAKNDMPCCLGMNIEKLPLNKAMAFDPIRQHRHFCPWIASVGDAAPGWQQTLSALQRQKEFSCPSSTSAQSSSMVEVADPVASVKNLLTPPSAKRMKLTRNSS